MSMNQAIVEVSELGKDFGTFRAVDSIDLRVHEGEDFGFLGPNGAGKSTTIHMLATLLRPSRGRAKLAGYDVAAQPNGVRRSIGLVFQDPSLDEPTVGLDPQTRHAIWEHMRSLRDEVGVTVFMSSGTEPGRQGRDEDQHQRDRDEGGITDWSARCGRRARSGRGTRRRR